MASEYLKQKYKDVRPEPPRELTKEEKRKNWWDYHKWHVAGGIAAALMVISFIWDIAGRGEPKPDFQIAYIGAGILPDDTAAAVESAIAACAEDLNGDGQVLVRMRQYVSSPDGDPSSVTAVSVQLMADLMACESYLFLLEDPDTFQQNYHALCYLDGTPPDENNDSAENAALVWSQCPALAELDLGEYLYDLFGGELTGKNQDLLAPLYIARRPLLTEDDMANQDAFNRLWDNLSANTVQ